MLFLRLLLDFLFPPRDSEALVAHATHETLGALARVSSITPHTVSLLPYRTPLVRATILEAKFRDNEHAQKLLAKILADYMHAVQEDFEAQIVLIPIPLSKNRLKERGYNQCERIARFTGTNVRIDTELLVRTRDTLPQTSLKRGARQENLRGAFSLSSTPEPSYTYIVFDDVYTTGATLAAAMDAFREAEIESVSGLSLAH